MYKGTNRNNVLEKENELTDKQILMYEKDVSVLRNKIELGSEINMIQSLEDQLYDKNMKLEGNLYRI